MNHRIISDGCHPTERKNSDFLSGGCHPTERSWMEVGRGASSSSPHSKRRLFIASARVTKDSLHIHVRHSRTTSLWSIGRGARSIIHTCAC
ncbi:unnamed protein product [Spirodela intermedia]|uniref:Uncharacterized protein n=1 Tax=Spirodela intermedia TaxID=51605 RepID=A0A7I8IUR0_SPIIN|nr:unnamed protein product [Spirodela intermedia]CAA6661351.1 unnamed protein product [Spirodela intermedia]